MKRTALLAASIATAALVAGCSSAHAAQQQPAPGAYADVNGLHMYYEVHGSPTQQPPLVLLHGALSGIGTDFGQLIPELAKTRQVIAVEQQAHGRTADIDRPLRTPQMAEDTVALLHRLGVQRADLLGYSMGAGVALQITLEHPELVRKQVLAAVALDEGGLQPGLLDQISELKPEMFHGSPFYDDYVKNAPRPADFPKLLARVVDHDQNATPVFPADEVRKIASPTLVAIGDSDIVTAEHAAAMFRLFGGGYLGDTPEGLPNSQLAVLPGTSHITLIHRPEFLLPMIPAFLDAPIRAGK